MSNKFKVGDKVVANEKANYRYNITTEGWQGIVIDIINENIIKVKENDSGTFYRVAAKCFDLVKGAESKNKIVITTDGIETLARLYEDGKVVKSATAKCCPDDTFDFEIGAKLAFRRLIGGKEKENEFVPYLISDGCHYGNIGEPTNLVDAIGRKLCVGDEVELYDVNLNQYENTLIVKRNGEFFVMGIQMNSNKGKVKDGWKIIKVRDNTEIKHNEKICYIRYVKEVE